MKIDSSLRVKIFAGIAAPLVFMLVLGVSTYLHILEVQESNRWVNHTHDVIEVAKDIIAGAVDMETGMRGYLLAGKEEFLEPYEAGSTATYQKIAELQRTVSDNPAQVKRLGQIRETLETWQTQVVEGQIALRREVGDSKTMNDLSRLVQQGRGKAYFDKFRGQIALFMEREQQLLDQRTEQSLKAERRIENSGDVERVSSLLQVLKENREWVTHTHQVLEKAQAILASAVDMETGMRGYLLAGEGSFLEPYDAGSRLFAQQIEELQEKVNDNPEQVELLGEMKVVIGEWTRDVVEPMIELRTAIGHGATMDDVARRVGKAEGKIFFDQFRNQIGLFIQEEKRLMEIRQQVSGEAMESSKSAIVTSLIFAFLVGSAIGYYVVVSVLRQIGGEPAAIEAIAKEVAEGNLAITSETSPSGIFAALIAMASRLRDTVGNVLDSASTVLDNSYELSSMAQSQSTSTTEQAASLEEITVTMNHLATNTRQNLDNARKTEKMAEQASENSDEGKKAVTQAIEALRDIAKRIGVIEEISYQINILSVNAAMEAARAGNKGLGFSVVATEIRLLAEHSQSVANDIKQLSATSLNLGENAERHIGLMVESFKQTSELVRDITMASNDQGSAISQINLALQQLDSVTQLNAQSVVDMSNTSKNLSKQAEQLKNNVSFFRL